MLELPKFTRSADELTTELDDWLVQTAAESITKSGQPFLTRESAAKIHS
jgi:hypothetical protein